jgi:hypothetical protein
MRIRLFHAMFLIAVASSGLRAGIVHRWSFNNTAGSAPAGTSVVDSVGTADGEVVGLGAAFNGTSLELPGNTNGNQTPANIAAYVDLPNGLRTGSACLNSGGWAR